MRLQKLIDYINKDGYGGIEYLYSVPGLVGGAVVMNAGRGRSYNQQIGDHVESVFIIKNGVIEEISVKGCQFNYRDSVFQHENAIIDSVIFRFSNDEVDIFTEAKQNRIFLCEQIYDMSAPNFGSVFSECSAKIMRMIQTMGYGNKKVHFSKKTNNWILNSDGNFDDIESIIHRVEKIHRLFHKNCKREIIVWR